MLGQMPIPDDQTRRLEREIGARIDAAVKADPRAIGKIAGLGISGAALDKIRQGKSTTQFAKLAQLAGALGQSPNALLGFESGEREVLIGALEGTLEGLGQDRIQAQELVQIVLTVIDRNQADDPAATPRGSARSVARFLIRQAVELARK
jgi:transcriptional regulator with XRE-family HTH domain